MSRKRRLRRRLANVIGWKEGMRFWHSKLDRFFD